MRRSFLAFATAVAVLGLAVVAQAQPGWYMDAGLEIVDLGEDLSGVDPGLGLSLEFGYDFGQGVALNFGIGSSAHDDAGFDVTYGRFWIGPRFTFDAGGLRPYMEMGLMSHFLDYDFLVYEIDGTGLYFSGGVLWPTGEGGGMGFYVGYSAWDGEDNLGLTGDVSTTVIGASYMLRFF